MFRKFVEQEILIASGNPGKITEITELFSPYNIKLHSITNFQAEEPEETGATFVENAKLKAEYYGKITNLPSLSDDSGISITALDGFPGIYSARFAGPNKDFNTAFQLIQQKLLEKGLDSSPAFFTCALALWWPDGHFEIFEGELHGKVVFPAQGLNGFGYNPIFVPDGHDRTIAQMTKDEKKNISHRSLAFNKMINSCFQ